MFTTTRRCLLGAAIPAVAFIPAAATGQDAPVAQSQQIPVAVQDGAPLDHRCPRGRHTVRDYRAYARDVYDRQRVRRRAHVRLAYMRKCQHSAPARRLVDRYHARFVRERVAQRFRPALASWYGPGLWGNPLGCGGTLTRGTVGVAHKTMPCGQQLRLCATRCATVRVVDRGPYVGAREFDLTAATAALVGFGGVGTVRVSTG